MERLAAWLFDPDSRASDIFSYIVIAANLAMMAGQLIRARETLQRLMM
jgi:hypothetical protein